jgi:hypothetical protein
MVSKASSILNTMCLSHHVGVQVWLDMVQTSNPFKIHILHEFFGYTKLMCTRRGVCVYVLALQCHNVFCFATWVTLCHDSIQSAFQKWLHEWPSIHSIEWMGVTNSFTVSTSVLPFALCTCLVVREEIGVKFVMRHF